MPECSVCGKPSNLRYGLPICGDSCAKKHENSLFWAGDIEKETLENTDYRRVIYTTQQEQLVVMSIDTNIGAERHPHTTQFIRIESGTGIAFIEGRRTDLFANMAVIIPAGRKHEIISNGPNPLKLYTIYSPPEHEDGLIQKIKPA